MLTSSASLQNIAATANPAGNQVDLAWEYTAQAAFTNVLVVRRDDRYPDTPDDGTVVARGEGLTGCSDAGLKAETIYYYGLFPFKGDPPDFEPGRRYRVSAMATGRYDFGRRMFDLLPAIYRRYDALTVPSSEDAAPDGTAPGDREHGQLRRFLDLPGSQLDQLHSLARASLSLHDAQRVDGNLLPLLAQWIGWKTDNSLDIDSQRSAIRYAPVLYQAIGLIPTVEATVKRITGWESSTKEFVQNVALTNHPERLRLLCQQRTAGTPAPGWGPAQEVSVNWAYEGRPAAVREADGSTTFYYHTFRKHGLDIWSKNYVQGEWGPSQPVADQAGIDRSPTAAMLGSQLWLFWQNLDDSTPGGCWRIVYRTRSDGKWSDTTALAFGDAAAEAATERRMPAAAADGAGGLWLFWLERTLDARPLDAGTPGNPWQVRYNRYDGTKWQLDTPATLPPDGGQDPRVEEDLYLLANGASPDKKLWLFWARHEADSQSGQVRWAIAYRAKAGLDPAASDWSAIQLVPKAASPAGYHDREPAALLANQHIELFWSSNREGSWSIWHDTLDTAALTWGTAERITQDESGFSERAPLPVEVDSGTLVVYRSSASVAHTSTVYGATVTLDTRSAGATTVDTRNSAKMKLQGQFKDYQTYTYDTGSGGKRDNDDRIARDTIGLYLAPPKDATAEQVQAGISRLKGVLPEFMPATVRAVFITQHA